jgi:hypothetical protein
MSLSLTKENLRMISLNNISTYKYCQISQEGNSSLEFGPNREVDIDLSSPKRSRYIVLSDGALRVMIQLYYLKKMHGFSTRELVTNLDH